MITIIIIILIIIMIIIVIIIIIIITLFYNAQISQKCSNVHNKIEMGHKIPN